MRAGAPWHQSVPSYGSPGLARPHGRVHYANAERSSWPQFMQGAVESGEAAARQVLADLR
ncbi:MAG: FAD-dependent oxidoreductase [Actinomycetota bacterium]|nr:FAD-dependent oxidoreductase [Actinomycetota bacterium]